MNTISNTDNADDHADPPELPTIPHDELIQTAQNLARNCGLPVFPCRAENKRPATPHGFKDASRDPTIIARLFRHPDAALIGIPTGEASGLSVLYQSPKPLTHIGY